MYKIGSKDWFNEERAWVISDIEFQLYILEEWRRLKAPDVLLYYDEELLRIARYKLKLLREGEEYVAYIKGRYR